MFYTLLKKLRLKEQAISRLPIEKITLKRAKKMLTNIKQEFIDFSLKINGVCKKSGDKITLVYDNTKPKPKLTNMTVETKNCTYVNNFVLHTYDTIYPKSSYNSTKVNF